MATPDFVDTRPFWQDLIRERQYTTPATKKARLAKILPGLSATRFHCGVMRVIIRGAIRARMGRYDRAAWARSCHDIFRLVENCGGKFRVSGLEHLASNNGAYVIVANHMASLETFVLGGLILPFRDMAFVLRRSLLAYPLFGVLLKAIQPIAVSRTNPREDLKQVLEQGTACLEKGRSVVVFPQSTRTTVFDASSFNSLGIKLARKAGVPVIPLALRTDFVKPGKVLKDFGAVDPDTPITLEFGPPMKVEGHGKDTQEAVISFITERLDQWGATVVRKPKSE